MVTCMVPLIFFIILMVCGILVNMYLYTHGMFQGRRSSGRAIEDWDKEYFSTDFSGRYDITGDYVRRGLLLAVAAILLACVVMITLLAPLWH